MAVPKSPKKKDNLSFSHLVPNLPSAHRRENLTQPDTVPLNSTGTVGLKDHLWGGSCILAVKQKILIAKGNQSINQSIRHKTHRGKL